jgi:hypothetical protein
VIPALPLEQIVRMAKLAEDPSNWVESPPIYYPAIFSHYGFDIGYAIRCKVRCPGGQKAIGPLPLRHLFIDYTEIEDTDEVPGFINVTVKAFRMDDYSVIKTEERGLHVYQRLFFGLPFEE